MLSSKLNTVSYSIDESKLCRGVSYLIVCDSRRRHHNKLQPSPSPSPSSSPVEQPFFVYTNGLRVDSSATSKNRCCGRSAHRVGNKNRPAMLSIEMGGNDSLELRLRSICALIASQSFSDVVVSSTRELNSALRENWLPSREQPASTGVLCSSWHTRTESCSYTHMRSHNSPAIIDRTQQPFHTAQQNSS